MNRSSIFKKCRIKVGLIIFGSVIFVLLVTILSYTRKNTAPLPPTRLLTNELKNPLNVEEPEFSWVVNDIDENEEQTAYEILLNDGLTDKQIWDSGKVLSSEQSYVMYNGPKLQAGYPYSWKVRTWDQGGSSSTYSRSAYFVTGLDDESWDASWISDGVSSESTKFNHYWYARYQVQLDASVVKVKKAFAFFSAIHDYDLYINDIEIGRGQSFDYEAEAYYQGWDVTDAVKRDSTFAVGVLSRNYGGGQGRAAGRVALLGHIKIYYENGSIQTVTTDNKWRISTDTPYSGTELRNTEGDFVEKYNAQYAQCHFSTSGFDDSRWKMATNIGSHPLADGMVRVQSELSRTTSYVFHPISVKILSDGTTVADFGKVVPARPSIIFKNGKANRKIIVQTGYNLNADGSINSTSSATQSTNMTYIYTQKKGEQRYDAWDHLAFRYISIPYCDEVFTVNSILAKIVHADVPNGYDSQFDTSNEMLNEVYELMKRSALYSMQNSFVDTPTREKGQFLQDSINISEASVITLYERAVSKKAIEQFLASSDRYWNDGRYNCVYPNGDGKRDIPDYTINFPFWVWSYYMQTGDKKTLKKAYPYIRATADYISRNIDSATGLVTRLTGGDGSPDNYQFGIVDWPVASRFGYDWENTKLGVRSTINMLSKRAFDVIANMAKELGNTADELNIRGRSKKLKSAINSHLINSSGVYCDGLDLSGRQVENASQHSTSFALAFNIAPEEYKRDMADYIAEMGMKQGPMTVDILAKALFNTKKSVAALNLFTDSGDCGWAREIENGYSFTWETWDADKSENSQSHGWGSAAAKQIIENFVGVRIIEAGAKKVKIAPFYCDIARVTAKIVTERGDIGVSYERSSKKFNITVKVPVNMTAELELPIIGDGKFERVNGTVKKEMMSDTVQKIILGSGVYEFEYDGKIMRQPECCY